MNDPERLSEQMDDPVGRAALRAMRGDAASDEAKQRALLALGLGGGLTAGSGAASAAGKAAAPLFLKWAAGGAAVVALAIGGSAYLAPADEALPAVVSARPASVPPPRHAPAGPSAPVAQSPAASTPSAPAAPAAAPPPRALEPRPEAASAPPLAAPSPTTHDHPELPDNTRPPADGAREPGATATTAVAVTTTVADGAAGQPAPASAAERLRLELAALDQVRRHLAARDGAEALRALDGYQATFPRGSLGIEATMLRIEALMVSGQATAARDLAARFIAAHPTNPLVPRVRSLVGMPADAPGTNP